MVVVCGGCVVGGGVWWCVGAASEIQEVGYSLCIYTLITHAVLNTNTYINP